MRGKFDEMKMQEGETITEYCGRIKDVVNSIRGANKVIDNKTMISKVLRNFLPIYVIRVFAIQELRCTTSSNLLLKYWFLG